jgi:hypothetical protein
MKVGTEAPAFGYALTGLYKKETAMRFVQIDILPEGKALVDIDKLTHAVPEGEGSRLFLGAQHLDVPHTLAQLENVLAGRDRFDDGENSRAGFGIR